MELAGSEYYRKPFKQIRLIVSIGCLLLAGTVMSCSHTGHNRQQIKGPRAADQILFQMKAYLDLTDEQEVKVRPIIEAQVKERNDEFEKCKDHGRDGRDYLKIELKDLRLRTEKQLQPLLTNEQLTRYGDMQLEEDQRIAGMISEKAGEGKSQGRGGGGRGGGGRGGRW